MPQPDRDQLKRLIDLLPEEGLAVATRVLLGLVALDRDPSVLALVAAPADRRVAPPVEPAAPLEDPLAVRGPETEQAKRLLLDLLEDG